MSFAVIIPVVNKALANSLLSSIERNTMLPNKVIIIDNIPGRTPYDYESSKINIQIFRNTKPLSVNESWRFGFERVGNVKYVTVLNDDILLNKDFFSRTRRVFDMNENCTVAIPSTVSEVDALKEFPISKFEIVCPKKREGWAYTIRKDILNQIPPIPDHVLKTFYGDDWIYLWTAKCNDARNKGWHWLMDRLNLVWHKGSVTVKRYGLTKDFKRERAIYCACVEEANKCV